MMRCKADDCNAIITDKGTPLVQGMSEAQMAQAGLPYIVMVQCSDCGCTFSIDTAKADRLPPVHAYQSTWYNAGIPQGAMV